MANNKIYIPTFISNEEFEPARVQPRIFYYNGTIETPDYKIYSQDVPSGASVETTTKSEMPYFDHYNVVTGSFPTAGSNSLLFFNELPSYGIQPSNTLFSEYWETYIELLYNPTTRLINAEAVIPLAEYFELELNDIVEWRGNYYHLRAVNEYSFSDGTCKLQLLGPIISDTLSPNTIDCYSYVLYADSEADTQFNWTDCDGVGQSTIVSAGSGLSVTCVRPGTVSANKRGATWEESGVCGSYIP